ncbi:hypothetical protein [Pseudocitrobacter cyperus]|uniref:Uncharacterized protein n=1 Tax=Pseudocitrobacter cyperus TaxID=3112843 RepID=A0ABV0HHS1_9ENTR
MSNRQIRRVNLSLHLSPEHSRADLRAMLHLKKWHEETNNAGGNSSDTSMEIRRFHRNVYLAGLQLQMLNPQLCSHIAESIGREALTLDELCAELSAGQLLPVAPPEPQEYNPEFSKQQLRQMRALMSDAAQRQPKGEEELSAMRSEIAQLKGLLEQQNLLLQQLRISGRAAPASVKASGAEEVDLRTLENQSQKMKQIKQKGIF